MLLCYGNKLTRNQVASHTKILFLTYAECPTGAGGGFCATSHPAAPPAEASSRAPLAATEGEKIREPHVSFLAQK